MRAAGRAVAQQCRVRLRCRAMLAGTSRACWLQDAHRMQCTDYLRAGGLRLNASKPRREIKRVVNDR
ncbi:MAG: hypothetical protein P4L71_03150 [Acetobacteraceae bacterium]|nr:hypothetical protein [Acetobacteraceae bacterium]